MPRGGGLRRRWRDCRADSARSSAPIACTPCPMPRSHVAPASRAAVAQGDFKAAEAIANDSNFGTSGESTLATAQLVLDAVRSRTPSDIKEMYSQCIPPRLNFTPADPAFGTCLVGFATLGDLNAVFALADRGYRDVECCSAAQQEEQWLTTGGFYNSRLELFGKVLASVRADSRFVEVARRTGLLAYWKSRHPPDFCSFERAPVCQVLRQER